MRFKYLLLLAGTLLAAGSLLIDFVGIGTDPNSFGGAQQMLLFAGMACFAIGILVAVVAPKTVVPLAVLANGALVAGSVAFVLALSELFIFPRFVSALPLKLHGLLPANIQVLAQSSKSAGHPDNYIAIVGDSFGVGLGDWLMAADTSTNPRFHSAHVLHERLKRDVVTFARSGADNVTSMVMAPQQIMNDFARTAWAYQVQEPATVLIYFYEGNDVEDNVLYLDRHFVGAYDRRHVLEPGHLDRFLAERASLISPLGGLRYNAPFVYFLVQLVRNFSLSGNSYSLEHQETTKDAPVTARIAGQATEIRLSLQSPVLASDEQLREGSFVFERSLHHLQRRFAGSAIHVVYIASPISTYDVLSPRFEMRALEGVQTVEVRRVFERSDDLCRRIERAAASARVGFLDTRPAMRKRAQQELVHGLKDTSHYNQAGYEELGEIVAAYLSAIPPQSVSCAAA